MSNASNVAAAAAPRLESVDLFRVIAIVGVTVIHTTPFVDLPAKEAGHFELLSVVINQLARYAVPFFFIASGYFWGAKVRRSDSAVAVSVAMVKRLLFLYVAWCLIYLLPYNLAAMASYGALGPLKFSYWNIQRLLSDPTILLFEGTHQHLWFLSALICAVVVTTVFVARGYTKTLIVVAVVLYVFGIAAFGYSDTPYGFKMHFTTRDGPFFSTIFFVTGYGLSGLTRQKKWLPLGASILAIGCAMHLFEVIYLWKTYNSYPLKDFVFGTYFMGLGVALMALSSHPWLRSNTLSTMGRSVQGVYLIHLMFVEILEPIDGVVHTAVWEIGYVILVLGLSFIAVRLLSRNGAMRRLLT